MPAKLLVESQGQTEREVPFDKPTITIGRKPKNDLQFDRAEISGSHAAFYFENSQYFISDLGSTNGTLLNGAQLIAREKYPLQQGDVITITPFRITFIMDEVSETMIESSSGRPGGFQVSRRSGTEPDINAKIAAAGDSTASSGSSADSAGPPPPTPKLEKQEAEGAPPPPPPSISSDEIPIPAPAIAVPDQQVSNPTSEKAVGGSGMTDYVWLGLGGLLLIAIIGLIVFLVIGL